MATREWDVFQSITPTSNWWQIQDFRFRKTELGSYRVEPARGESPITTYGVLVITVRGGREYRFGYSCCADADKVVKALDVATGLTNDRSGRRSERTKTTKVVENTRLP